MLRGLVNDTFKFVKATTLVAGMANLMPGSAGIPCY